MSIETAKELIVEAKAKGHTRLDLGNCGLTDLEEEIPELFELTQLEELYVSNEWRNGENELMEYSQNRGKNNVLSKFPNAINQLINLKVLVCSGEWGTPWHFENISKLSNLKYLKVLHFSYNQLSDISVLSELKNLVHLNLTYNQLLDISVLSELKNLATLNLSENLVTDIRGLSELKNLATLNLSENEITDIRGLSQLKNLVSLYLHSNRITDIGALSQLKNLKTLDLGNNQINDISGLSELKNLEMLNLWKNYIIDIRPLQPLMKRLNQPLQYTATDDYPKAGEICLGKNPITTPPLEIVEQGNEAIIAYFDSIDQADKEEFLYEAKLVIVGRGAAGKTTLVKKLTDNNFHLNPSEPTTTGIAILGEPWQLPMSGLHDKDAFTLNIWDFGGQEKYDATHQFFITERTVYLFLTEARKESNYMDYDYWLRTIELLSKKSPVIVVQTKTDERDKEMPESAYREQFENIVAFVKISCADGWEDTLERLKAHIKTAVRQLRQNKEQLSNRWIAVREELQVLSKEQDYISYKKYIEICTKHKIPASQADFLSGFLHDLGIIIHHQKDLKLKHTVIINPEWGVDGVYKVIDDKETISNKGSFTETDLQRIWDEAKYNEKQPELLGLMKKFELCFEVKPEHYIAPELLSLKKPEDFDKVWQATKVLPYRYAYHFMPAGIMGRLIVKGHDKLYKHYYWKTGAIFEYQKSKALVEEFYFEKRLHITLEGDEEDCKDLLTILRQYINTIHQNFDNLPVKELLPCCCPDCKGSADPYFYPYEVVKKAEKNPNAGGKLQCQISFMPISIANIKLSVYNKKGLSEGKTVKELVERGRLLDALNALNQKDNTVILLKQQLKDCQDNHLIGTISDDDCNRIKAKISKSILTLCDED